MTICHDLTEIDAAIEALRGVPVEYDPGMFEAPPNDEALADCRNFALRMAALGVSAVDVDSDAMGGAGLLYDGEGITVWYAAMNTGARTVCVTTRRDNGHDGTMMVDPKRYGLIAAMLLART